MGNNPAGLSEPNIINLAKINKQKNEKLTALAPLIINLFKNKSRMTNQQKNLSSVLKLKLKEKFNSQV